jgi:hypothetical protein
VGCGISGEELMQNCIQLLTIHYIAHIMILLNRRLTSSFLDPNIKFQTYTKFTFSAKLKVNEILTWSVSTDMVYLPIGRFGKASNQAQDLNDLISLKFSCMYMKMWGGAVRLSSM